MTPSGPISASEAAKILAGYEASRGGPTAGRTPDSDIFARRHFQWRGEQLYCGGLWVGEIMQWQSAPHVGRWRAWVMTQPPGAHHGWFASDQEARRQVEHIAGLALTQTPSVP